MGANLEQLVESVVEQIFGDASRDSYGLLPDRFLEKEYFENLINLVFPQHLKLKSYESTLRKYLSDVSPNRETLRKVPAVDMLFMIFTTAESREHFYQSQGFSVQTDHPLVLEARASSLLEKVISSCGESRTPLPDEVVKIAPSNVINGYPVLENHTSEADYTKLGKVARNYVDLLVNIVLVHSERPAFIKRFFDAYPWIKANQQKFYDATVKHLEKHGDPFVNEDETLSFKGITSEWANFLLARSEYLSRKSNSRIAKIASTYRAFDKMIKSESGPTNAFDTAIREDAHEIINALTSVDEAFAPAEKFIKGRKIKELIEQAEQAFSYSFAGASLTGDFVEQVVIYAKVRGDTIRTIKEVAGEAVKRADSVGRVSRYISQAIESGDLEKLAKIAEASAELNEQASKFTDEVCHIFVAFDAQMDEFQKLIQISENQKQQAARVQHLEEEVGSVTDAIRSLETQLGSANDQLLALQSELKEKNTQLESLNAAHEELELSVHERDETIASLKQEVHGLKMNQAAAYQKSSKSSELGGGIDHEVLATMLRNMSFAPAEQLRIFGSVAADRVVILPSAFKSAEDASNFQYTARLADTIYKLIFPYLDALRSGQPDSEAKGLLPASYAARESMTVENHKRLRGLREFDYMGEKVYFDAHVAAGGGYGTQNMVRLQFKYLDEKIVIAYCGEHLEVASTN